MPPPFYDSSGVASRPRRPAPMTDLAELEPTELTDVVVGQGGQAVQTRGRSPAGSIDEVSRTSTAMTDLPTDPAREPWPRT